MTIPVAESIVGGPLGRTTKMPCPSWGISARACQRAIELSTVEGTVCSKCYARRGHYIMPSVRTSHERRLAALEHPDWVAAMTVLIDAFSELHFRWFDSGDLQGLHHLEMIVEVCRGTPHIRHWLPTHEPYTVGRFLQRGGVLPANLVVRISADRIGERPDTPTYGLPTHTVHDGDPIGPGVTCLAHERGNRCGPCRACWDPQVPNTSFPLK